LGTCPIIKLQVCFPRCQMPYYLSQESINYANALHILFIVI